MRVVGLIPHPEGRITLLAWNQKYLVKFELGDLEQTFKIPQLDVATEAQLREAVSQEFIEKAFRRFQSMREDLDQILGG